MSVAYIENYPRLPVIIRNYWILNLIYLARSPFECACNTASLNIHFIPLVRDSYTSSTRNIDPSIIAKQENSGSRVCTLRWRLVAVTIQLPCLSIRTGCGCPASPMPLPHVLARFCGFHLSQGTHSSTWLSPSWWRKKRKVYKKNVFITSKHPCLFHTLNIFPNNNKI